MLQVGSGWAVCGYGGAAGRAGERLSERGDGEYTVCFYIVGPMECADDARFTPVHSYCCTPVLTLPLSLCHMLSLSLSLSRSLSLHPSLSMLHSDGLTRQTVCFAFFLYNIQTSRQLFINIYMRQAEGHSQLTSKSVVLVSTL